MDSNESILNTLKGIQSLRDLLKSEMSIDDSGEGEVIVKIKVHNDAPESHDGGDIVFLGVGLRIIVGRDGGMQGGNACPSRIRKERTSDRMEVRHKYNEGMWVAGTEGSFPEVTADEQSHGEVLFPGEGVLYEIKTSRSELPYMDIRVEGSVSRRHLFHISQQMEALKALTQPLVVATFRALDAIDFYTPLLRMVDTMPDFGPQTTLAEIDAFKAVVGNAQAHVRKVWQEANDVGRSAPNQKIRDFLDKNINGTLGQYFLLATQICDKTLEALSSGDTRKMKEASEELKAQLLKAEEVKCRQADLMSQFGLDSG